MIVENKPAKAIYNSSTMLGIVSAETTVSPYLLAEDEGLADLWHKGATLAELIDFANENY